jgi:DNA gyrase subunit A
MDNIGLVRQVKIDEEMRGSYLDYAMSVIVSRALPDARDGLKPVHRRILYAMWDMGMRAGTPYRKSARLVGEVLGKLHPHGDTSVYDAMVRMAQDFSMRYPLVDGQGNFGSLDGDPPAAMRYTEARMARIAEELLIDIDSDTVDFAPNFDDSLEEPVVLPARLPNLLLNGASGIAVGMATNIPPHNLNEITAAINYLIEKMVAYEGENLDDAIEDVTVDDLMQFVTGPDFPTGALMGGIELREVYATGKGRIIMRARCEIEQVKDDRFRIVVHEIPYQVNKASTLERIAELVREGRLTHIVDLRDESDRNGMRIVIELSRDAQPKLVLNRLYKYTQLQTSFSVQMLALVDNEPRLLSLKRALHIYIQHRQEVIRRRSEYELGKARARAHILEGLLTALANLDDVIQTIRNADSAEQARTALTDRFNLSQEQAQAILDMQLRRLAALERQKIEDEYKQVREYIEYLEDLLASPAKVLGLIQEDLADLLEKFGDERRTVFAPEIDVEFDEADLIRDEEVLVSLSAKGYIKSTPASIYRAQRRGGRGVMGMTTRDEDAVEHIFSAGTLDHILFFTNRGKVYSQRTYQLPQYDRSGRGTPVAAVIALEPLERVTATLVVPDFDADGYFMLCTRYGRIKRVHFSDFAAVRPSGLIAISLEDDDELGWVRHTEGDHDVIVVTRDGMSIRFHEEEVRVMGRPAAGVNAIKLMDKDEVAAVDVIAPDESADDLLVITEFGFGKRTSLEEFSAQSRYGKGIIAFDMKKRDRTGLVAGAMVVNDESDITAITVNGITLRTSINTINRYGRNTMGVHVMNLDENDFIVSVAVVESNENEGANHNGDLPEDGDLIVSDDIDFEADSNGGLTDNPEFEAGSNGDLLEASEIDVDEAEYEGDLADDSDFDVD